MIVNKNDPQYNRHPDKPLDIIFMECQCMVWPIARGYSVRSCRYCGVEPFRVVSEPFSGKAEPIRR